VTDLFNGREWIPDDEDTGRRRCRPKARPDALSIDIFLCPPETCPYIPDEIPDDQRIVFAVGDEEGFGLVHPGCATPFSVNATVHTEDGWSIGATHFHGMQHGWDIMPVITGMMEDAFGEDNVVETTATFDRLYATQDGKCAVCGPQGVLVIDRDHDGRALALLCWRCEDALTAHGRDPRTLRKAAQDLAQTAGELVERSDDQ
jgi:hypothetical protein